ncbi:uncharacterized protein LOC122045742 isoform X1 [Zingiber officinale]|uniref:uncharacterized protein LOC122045742 isoform X1 n=1 Tax=Zingiber officinale TaxID=94328 RepID=UPI001C4CE247|nr:uncharacterized protein LOC122045742 isoform X1 [Zingiber officinale]
MMKRGRRLWLPVHAITTSGIFWPADLPASHRIFVAVISRRMLQFPAFMRQMTSPPLIPTSTLFPVAAHAQNDVEALAILEGELEDKLSEIRKGNSNQTVIGKKVVDSKEELEAGAEDEEVDNVGDSEGDEFEQETG